METSQLLGFTCYSGIKNERSTRCLGLFDGTNIHVLINHGDLDFKNIKKIIFLSINLDLIYT